MGASQSTSQDNPPARALHVLRVTPSSPASKTSIEPYFDFVAGFEGASLSHENSIDASLLERIVESHEERTLNLLVWSIKSRKTRVVPIRPSRAWSQTADNSTLHPNDHASQPSLLGLSMRMCEPENATENVWHVLDVIEGSPAESAGLVPMGDWILGWSGGVLGAENDFYDLVEAHVDKPLRVYVYSYDFDALREVVLMPNRHWGGEGLLGCVFGFGLLHRIPPQPDDRVPGSTPIELQQAADEYEEQELFVPADAHHDPQFNTARLEEWRQQGQEQWNQGNVASNTPYSQQEQYAQEPTISVTQDYSIGHTEKPDNDFEQDHRGIHDFNQHDSSFSNRYTNEQQMFLDDSKTPTQAATRPPINGRNFSYNILVGYRANSDKSATPAEEGYNNGDAEHEGVDGDNFDSISVAGVDTLSQSSLISVD